MDGRSSTSVPNGVADLEPQLTALGASLGWHASSSHHLRPLLLRTPQGQSEPVFARQQVGVRHVDERLWLVTLMHYDLGYFDDETCRLEPIEYPFGPTVLPMFLA